MRISLDIQGKAKTFSVPFVSGRALRRTLEIAKNTNFNDVDADTLDTLVDYVVELFKNQFTRDDFYDGIEASELLNIVVNCIQEVIGNTSKATAGLSDPNGRK